MQRYLEVVQIFISIVLIVLVLAQSRGAGLTAGSNDQTTLFRTRRGVEKTLFQVTLVFAGIFLLVSIASVLASRL